MEERVNQLLPLATNIAREFDNIPGLPHAEIELAAHEVLAHAARLFDPAKGDFAAYAARAMRNSLRELLEELAAKNTEGNLSSEEREEYAGYVRANKFVAVLRREAKKFKPGSAA